MEARRVLLIANTLPPRDISGVGEQVLQLASGLRERGLEVEVLGRGRGGARGPKVLFPLTVVPAVVLALLRLRPHVVQVHESDGALAALTTVALRILLRPRPRLFALQQVSYVRELRAVAPIRDRGGRVLGNPGGIERRFLRFKGPSQVLLGRITARLADRVLAPSRVTGDELEEDYGVGPVAVLPNVTGGLERAVEPSPAPEEVGTLLFVGRLRIRKGVEVLLEALGSSSLRLLIAGDGEHREALETACGRLGLENRVRFLGPCSASEIRSLLNLALALVVPSTYEGMPLVILEAMEQSTPVVASAVSGIPEVVLDGETGWLVPPEDVESLEEALRFVAENQDEAQRRGEAGFRRLEAYFRPARAAQLWHDLAFSSPAEERGD